MRRTCQLEDFCSQILQDGRGVYGSLGAYTHVELRALFEVPVDTADGELEGCENVK